MKSLDDVIALLGDREQFWRNDPLLVGDAMRLLKTIKVDVDALEERLARIEKHVRMPGSLL